MPSLTGKLSLCWGSMEGVGFTAFLEAAAHAGFAAVTLNGALLEDARREGLGEPDVQRRLKDLGLGVSGIDPLFNWIPGAPQMEGDDIISRCTRASTEQVFQAAHAVGSDLVNAPLGFATPDSEQQIIDCFGALCTLAAEEDLRVSLEFMPFTAVANLQTAARIVTEANCSNGGIMIDCWHHHRAGGSAADVLEVPAERFFAMQLDDALPEPMGDIVQETLNHRLLPGEGCIDLLSLLGNLKKMGAEFVYDVEVFKASLREDTPQERADTLFRHANAVVQAA